MSDTFTPDATLNAKVQTLMTTLDAKLIERTDVIDTMVLAVLSKRHHFQLGSPGVAKSMSIRLLSEHIGGFNDSDLFETLLTRFTGVEEVFGPYDLKALEDGQYVRILDGFLARAKFAFMDEIFKASAALLNSLLWALNERNFRNGTEVYPMPLHSMFCASNELPDGEELNALYDRVTFRVETKPIQEPGAFIRMLEAKAAQTLKGVQVITWDEIEQACAEVDQVSIPRDVMEALTNVRLKLSNEGIHPTDRRFADSLQVIKAAAWMDGRGVADVEDCRPLAHMLWTSKDERPKVQSILLELANPLDKRALDLMADIDKIQSELEDMLRADEDPQLRNKRGVELNGKVTRARKELVALANEVKASGRRTNKVKECKTRLMNVARVLITEVFKIEGVDSALLDKQFSEID